MMCALSSSSIENDEILSRRQVRSLILHLLYAVESFEYEESLYQIIVNFNKGFNLTLDPKSEVATTVQALIDQREKLDEYIKPLLINWRFERVGICTRLILRLAVWELLYTDTAVSVIINEAIELAKCFSEKDAHKFINGILDKLAKEIRESSHLQ